MNYGQKKNECKDLCYMIGTGTCSFLCETENFWLGFFLFFPWEQVKTGMFVLSFFGGSHFQQ